MNLHIQITLVNCYFIIVGPELYNILWLDDVKVILYLHSNNSDIVFCRSPAILASLVMKRLVTPLNLQCTHSTLTYPLPHSDITSSIKNTYLPSANT